MSNWDRINATEPPSTILAKRQIADLTDRISALQDELAGTRETLRVADRQRTAFERAKDIWQADGLSGRRLAGAVQKALDGTEWGDDFEAEVRAALATYREDTREFA